MDRTWTVIDIKLFFAQIPVNYSHNRYASQTTIRLNPQPSIAPDTLANHALWSFGDAQSSVDPGVYSGKMMMGRTKGLPPKNVWK